MKKEQSQAKEDLRHRISNGGSCSDIMKSSDLGFCLIPVTLLKSLHFSKPYLFILNSIKSLFYSKHTALGPPFLAALSLALSPSLVQS